MALHAAWVALPIGGLFGPAEVRAQVTHAGVSYSRSVAIGNLAGLAPVPPDRARQYLQLPYLTAKLGNVIIGASSCPGALGRSSTETTAANLGRPDEVFHLQARRARGCSINGLISLDPYWTYAQAGHGQKESQP